MISMKKRVGALLALLVVAASSVPGRAEAGLLYTGSSGNLSASALFELNGNALTITLTNTSTADVKDPTDVLTGVFFDTSHTLTPVSASLNGSIAYYGSIIHDVGEGWQYKAFANNNLV